jgi:hypothetical protein
VTHKDIPLKTIKKLLITILMFTLPFIAIFGIIDPYTIILLIHIFITLSYASNTEEIFDKNITKKRVIFNRIKFGISTLVYIFFPIFLNFTFSADGITLKLYGLFSFGFYFQFKDVTGSFLPTFSWILLFLFAVITTLLTISLTITFKNINKSSKLNLKVIDFINVFLIFIFLILNFLYLRMLQREFAFDSLVWNGGIIFAIFFVVFLVLKIFDKKKTPQKIESLESENTLEEI